MPERKPYTYVRLILDDGPLARFEVRTSIFVEFDDNHGRRAVTGKPTKKQALELAQEIARRERARTGG
jgi:hypothetical protein